MIRTLKITEDGSHTVLCHDTGENFHSDQGSVMESLHVFIQSGLHYFDSSANLNIFEVGFGTGLIAMLTYEESLISQRKIHYETTELYPLEKEIWSELNYSDQHNFSGKNILQKLHEAEWNSEIKFDKFSFIKHPISLFDFITDKKFNLVYFDAFSPEKQPEMWTTEVFQRIFDLTEPGGIVVTYCAKSDVRRAMEQVGFKVEKLKGAGRKREMIRAHKPKE